MNPFHRVEVGVLAITFGEAKVLFQDLGLSLFYTGFFRAGDLKRGKRRAMIRRKEMARENFLVVVKEDGPV